MQNFLASRPRCLSSLSNGLSLLVGLGSIAVFGSLASAQSPEKAPQELKETISQIDAAANRRDLKGVLQFYSPNFVHSDGLKPATLSQALTQLWEKYDQLTYQTQLQSWEKEEDGIVAETVTQISGTEKSDRRTIRLDSTIHSRQYYQGQQLVRQEILSEETKVTSGEAPPEVKVNVPELVEPGQQYNFDVIVQEPLGDDVLLGTAIEEAASSDLYLTPSTLELELLSAGGIFKIVQAPSQPTHKLLSAVLVRDSGITQITRRVRVQGEQ